MKKLIIILLLCATNTFAKDHVLLVQRLSYWAPDYLTVTCNWDNLYFTQRVSTLKMFSVITAVNGESTKDMEPEDFYDVIDNNDSFTLTYLTKTRGENKEFTKHLTKRKGDLLRTSVNCSTPYYGNGDWSESNIIIDNNTDFFQYNTYDFLITDENSSGDKGLLTYIASILNDKGMVNNPETPDVYLCLSRNASMNIESVWVSKIVSKTTSDSYTSGGGNVKINKKRDNIDISSGSSTYGNSKTVAQDQGYAEEIANGDMFFQISIIDEEKVKKKYNNPVVWQLTYSKHFNRSVNFEKRARDVCDDIRCYPSNSNKRNIFTHLGLFLENNSGIITDVIPDSKAWQSGISIGDSVKKIKYFLNKESWKPSEGHVINTRWTGHVTIFLNNKGKIEVNSEKVEFY